MPLATKTPIGSEVKSRLPRVRSPWWVTKGNTPQPFSSLKIASPSTCSLGKNPAVILNFALYFTIQSCLQKKPQICPLLTCSKSHHCLCPGDKNRVPPTLLSYHPFTQQHSGLSKPVNQIMSLTFVRPFPVIPSYFFKTC